MTTAVKLKKATFKDIESELYSYKDKDTLKEIEQLRKNIMFCKESDDENVGVGRSSLPSSPTESIAKRLATHKRLNQFEEVTKCILVCQRLIEIVRIKILEKTTNIYMGWLC